MSTLKIDSISHTNGSSPVLFPTGISCDGFIMSYEWIDPRTYGTEGTQAAIESALAGRTSLTGLFLSPVNWDITSDLTIPTNITLLTFPGTTITISDGVTLTINGKFEAGLYNVFILTGTGKVDFSSAVTKSGYAEWWGATGAGISLHDDTTAIAAALDSGLKKIWGIGTYGLSDSVEITNSISWEFLSGAGFDSALTVGNHPDQYILVSANNVEIIGPTFSLGAATAIDSSGEGCCFALTSGVSNFKLNNSDLRYFYNCVKAKGTWNNVRIENNTLVGVYVDISFQGTGVYGYNIWIQNNDFPVNRNWSSPVTHNSNVTIRGGFTTGAVISDSVYLNNYCENVFINDNRCYYPDGRPLRVSNAINVHINDNIIKAACGDKTIAGIPDDLITMEFIRGGTVNGNDLDGGGENGVDVLSCSDTVVNGNSMKSIDNMGVMIAYSDQIGLASISLSRQYWACRNISVNGNTIHAANPIGICCGQGVSITGNSLRLWAGHSAWSIINYPYIYAGFPSAEIALLYTSKGKHNGSNNSATLNCSTINFIKWGVVNGMTVYNLTDGCYGVITNVAANVLTFGGGLSGGTDNDFDTNDIFYIADMDIPELPPANIVVSGNSRGDDGISWVSSVSAVNDTFTFLQPHGFITGEGVEIETSSATSTITLPSIAEGTHDGGNNSAHLIDSTTDFYNTAKVTVGCRILNTTKVCNMLAHAVSSGTPTRINTDQTAPGSTDWDNGDGYKVLLGHAQRYFVYVVDSLTVKLSATRAGALAGTGFIPIVAANLGTGQFMGFRRSPTYLVSGDSAGYWRDFVSANVMSLQKGVFDLYTDDVFYNFTSGKEVVVPGIFVGASNVSFEYIRDPYLASAAPGTAASFRWRWTKSYELPHYYEIGANSYGLRVNDMRQAAVVVYGGSDIGPSVYIPTDGVIRVRIY